MNWRMISQVLAIFAALVPFGPTACHRIVQKPTPEVPLPDGKCSGAKSFDELFDNGCFFGGEGFQVINFSGEYIDGVGIDEWGFVMPIYPEWGYSTTAASFVGMFVVISKELKSPFYIRVSWNDGEWYERKTDAKYGVVTPTYGIGKSRLIKVRHPLPKDPKAMLLIFRTNDRVDCEIFDEVSHASARVESLRMEEPKP